MAKITVLNILVFILEIFKYYNFTTKIKIPTKMSIQTILCTYTLAKNEYRTVQRSDLILNYWSAVAALYKLYAFTKPVFCTTTFY